MHCVRPALNWIVVASAVLCPLVSGQQAAEVKPIVLANDKLEFTISPMGGRFNKITLKDGDPISPIAAISHFWLWMVSARPPAKRLRWACRFMAKPIGACSM